MRTIKHIAVAGSSVKFYELAKYFHLLETVTPVTIKFYNNGAITAEAQDMEGGFFDQPSQPFDAIEIYSALAQTIKFAISDGSGGYNRFAGSVSITNAQAVNGALAQTAPAVTNASGALLAANAARRSVMVQNNHATGNIFITLNGAAATLANGIKISPGSLILLDVFAPTAAINAIGDVANNTAVIVVEG